MFSFIVGLVGKINIHHYGDAHAAVLRAMFF